MKELNSHEDEQQLQYKLLQRKRWDQNADGWIKWSEEFEKGAHMVSDRLVQLANVKTGQNVLDIATGYGEPAVTAAKIVQPGGSVFGIDISPQMLEIAKERAANQGLHDIIGFEEGDIDKLSLQRESFDAILCRWGLMLFTDLDKTLPRIRQSLAIGGRFSAAVWGRSDKVPMLSLPLKIISDELDVSKQVCADLRPFNLSSPAILQDYFVRTGFANVNVMTQTVTFEIASVEDYIAATKEMSAPIREMFSNETEKRQEGIWRAFADMLKREYTESKRGGQLRFNNEVIFVVGERE
jgi:ubiquinone/menaquinone biosynthesis C-methylase UbiE